MGPESLPAVTYPQRGDSTGINSPLRSSRWHRSPRLLGVSVADFRPDLDPTGGLAVRVLDVLERTLP